MSSEVALDLNRRAWTRVKGNVTAIGSWLRLGGSSWQPCMVLVRTGEELGGDMVPCVIPMSNAYLYEPGVSDPTQALHAIIKFCAALRIGDTKGTRTRLLLFINDCLDDLLNMRPFPPDDAPGLTLGEVTLTNANTGETSEFLLKDV